MGDYRGELLALQKVSQKIPVLFAQPYHSICGEARLDCFMNIRTGTKPLLNRTGFLIL